MQTDPSKTDGKTALDRSDCSEAEMAKLLARWRDRILHKAATKIDRRWLDKPTEDFTTEEEGYERGISDALNDVCSLMDDPSYFGRSPQNNQAQQRREERP